MRHKSLVLFTVPLLSACAGSVTPRAEVADAPSDREWLAGDHHIHSEYSAAYTIADSVNNGVPTPVLGADGRYAISLNAQKAREHGLRWMVSTDHGGPNHSKLNYEEAYPSLERSRESVPDIIQFYGMEFDTPGADHSSMIMPHSHNERETLRDIESRFSKRDAYPRDPGRDTEPKMLEALTYMRGVATPPVVIANHPSRSASGVGEYGLDRPAELRDWNDTAPNIAVGMEGAPGHQASALNRDGSIDSTGARGGYRNSPTLGGFDQMTALLGGFWDSMLGEGRRWWVTSTSDSHQNWREGGSDFWPGEYSKTYVQARPNHDDILDGIRNGRVFVTTGDLVSQVDVATSLITDANRRATIGGRLMVPDNADVLVTIRVRDPAGTNHHGDSPTVSRIDLIMGDVVGRAADRTLDRNATTRVVQRFTAADWTRDGEMLSMSYTLRDVNSTRYIRVRGTNTSELEPSPDPRGEDPWTDLWFYANPVFLEVR